MSKPETDTPMDQLTPAEIVERLDEYIVGQNAAKRAVAVAIRNRWRRRRLPDDIRDEVTPKNILMIGPTGVGKTEIARRLAAMIRAPFLKVEASKYTEVGYHGRDVESMIRDLVKAAVAQVRGEERAKVEEEAAKAAEERVLNLLLPAHAPLPADEFDDDEAAMPAAASPSAVERPATAEEQARKDAARARERRLRMREKLRTQLRGGGFDERRVEIDVDAPPPAAGVLGMLGNDEMAMEFQEMMGKMVPGRKKKRSATVPEALRLFTAEEAEKRVDEEATNRAAVERAEQSGIVFIDEVDKIIGSDRSDGPDVSREGVQRDLLPIVEGTTVTTKYGPVATDHILFIAAGAFHGKKPADLMPELQGRFPIRIELSPLTREDFRRILVHPKNALTKQYQLLFGAEGVRLEFPPEALDALAGFAEKVNRSTQDIGARRLHTLMERLLEDLSFDAHTRSGERVVIDAKLVDERLAALAGNEDLSRYIL